MLAHDAKLVLSFTTPTIYRAPRDQLRSLITSRAPPPTKKRRQKERSLQFQLKIQKLQTHLDMWSSRSLTLFGKVLIIKSLGLSQILYSVSNTNVPKDTITTVKGKLFSFLWNKKKDKIKTEGLNQDYDKGGIRMTDVGLMLRPCV